MRTAKLRTEDPIGIGIILARYASVWVRLWLMGILLCLHTQAARKTVLLRDVLSTVDLPHPACSAPMDLNIGRDYFISISNDLPGRQEYNDLVLAYQRGDWVTFDKAGDHFRRVFDSSPLIEATHFLMVQVELERTKNARELAESEKHFRELLLLYPKSTLVPVITASMAYYWLRSEQFEKSLSLYEKGRIQFDNSPIQCVFLMGTAETQYQMNEWVAAKTALGKVLEKCFNRRLQTVAQLRQLDLDRQEKRSIDVSEVEKIIAISPVEVAQFYPWVLQNVAEHYYWQKQYKKAKFYFLDYIRQPLAEPVCAASAQKRLADIALRTGESLSRVVGRYFEVPDVDKSGRWATFSYLHGLLATYDLVSASEKSLRFSIFDKRIQDVSAPEWRSIAFLEKGLAALSAGELSSIGYLVRFHQRETEAGGPGIGRGPTAEAIRSMISNLLTRDRSWETDALNELTAHLSAVKSIWDPPGVDYTGLRVSAFESLVLQGTAREFLERARELRHVSVSTLERARLTRALWKKISSISPEGLVIFWNNRELLQPLTSQAHLLMWFSLAVRQQAVDVIEEWTRIFRKNSSWVAAKSPLGIYDPAWELARGDLLERLGHWDVARKTYAAITDTRYRFESMTRQFAIAKYQDSSARLLQLGPDLIKAAPRGEKEPYFGILLDQVVSKKLWHEVSRLEKLVPELGLESSSEIRLSFAAARAAYERRNWEAASAKYELALKKAPEHLEANEAFYKWGKCLSKKGDLERAKEIWGGLVSREDKFWSPLAKNELALLERRPASVTK